MLLLLWVYLTFDTPTTSHLNLSHTRSSFCIFGLVMFYLAMFLLARSTAQANGVTLKGTDRFLKTFGLDSYQMDIVGLLLVSRFSHHLQLHNIPCINYRSVPKLIELPH